ncbi:MAG: hypothetical protein ETSY1_45940 [Candidatus Entotheonella factor]|uniref:Uncharacterized protein n=1 Tax=Entotheonella factor TaxID=1429438 RepID=W4L3P8_ENTF1|nr:MAG: hypothetical protein ETSY1_45940 [Candidatus Entotheonella factor]
MASLIFLYKVAELQQQLQSSEREKEMLRQQLTRKEAELDSAGTVDNIERLSQKM